MKKVGFLYNPIFLEHDSGAGHPESPKRLEAILRMLEKAPFSGDLIRVEDFTPRAPESLHLVHDFAYVEWVEERIREGYSVLDWGDTRVGPHSYEAALKAADAAVEAAVRVWTGGLDRAFVAPRPPGHHAEHNRAMGFCIFNNIAVAAAWMLNEGAKRLAIVDWDVHHGNGTQNTFYSEPRVLFISLHQYPHYPGTGAADERGSGEAVGTTMNFPMRAGSGDEEYLQAFDNKILPALEEFAPEMILISAGFDAHRRDPLSSIQLSTKAYGEMTSRLCNTADKLCGGKVVSILEGGYDLGILQEAVGLHITKLME
jgi:acetoin utilization deacetylase AcuC-like enzyme